MPSSFTFYNSWWRNLALMVLFALVAVPSLLVGFFVIFRDNALLVGFGTFGFGTLMLAGTIMSGFRVFDRRPRVKIDADGVRDYRTRYGNIPWSEISDLRLSSVKGNDVVTLTLRSPEQWIARANAISRFITSLMGSKRFRITIWLANMDVNGEELRAFMTYMISRAQQGARPDGPTSGWTAD